MLPKFFQVKALNNGNIRKTRGVIEKSNLISFDVFDTLIVRKVTTPKDVFLLIDLALRGKYSPVVDFLQKRVKAEESARKSSPNNDVTLDEIYKKLKLYLPSSYPIDSIKNKEKKAEEILLDVHPLGWYFYNYALKRKKRIAWISDMYLEKDFIRSLLRRMGYKIVDFFHVSSEDFVIKGDGGAFEKLIKWAKKEGIKAKDIVHMGDNFWSDVVMPMRKGIKALFIKRLPEYVSSLHAIWKSMYSQAVSFPDKWIRGIFTLVYGLLVNKYSLYLLHMGENVSSTRLNKAFRDSWYFMGYVFVAPLLLGYVLWISVISKRAKLEALYFLGRDGYLPYQVYRYLRKTVLKHWNLPTPYYLVTSRRMVTLPVSAELEPSKVFYYITGDRPGFKVKDYLRRIDVDIPRDGLVKGLKQAGLTLSTRIKTKKDFEKLNILLEAVGEHILSSLISEQKLLIELLKRKYEVGKYKRIGFVDLGWSGNMQTALLKLIEKVRKDYRVVFFFLGIQPTDSYLKLRRHRKVALYSFVEDMPTRFGNLWESIEIIEEFCSPVTPTAIKVYQEKDEIKIKYGSQEPSYLIKMKKNVFEGTMNFITDFVEVITSLEIQFPFRRLEDIKEKRGIRWFFMLPYLRLVRYPTRIEATLLGDIPHSQGIGDAVKWVPIAAPPVRIELIDFLFPFSFFSKTREIYNAFKSVFWKRGFLKRLGYVEKLALIIYFLYKKYPSDKIITVIKKKVLYLLYFRLLRSRVIIKPGWWWRMVR